MKAWLLKSLSAKDSNDDDDNDMYCNCLMKHAVYRWITNTILGAKSYLVPELK